MIPKIDAQIARLGIGNGASTLTSGNLFRDFEARCDRTRAGASRENQTGMVAAGQISEAASHRRVKRSISHRPSRVQVDGSSVM